MSSYQTQNTMTRTRVYTQSHRYSKRKPRISAETKYYIMQKLVGVIVVVGSIFTGIVAQEFAVIFFGLMFGVPLIFIKEKILMIGKVYWEEHPIKNRSFDD